MPQTANFNEENQLMNVDVPFGPIEAHEAANDDEVLDLADQTRIKALTVLEGLETQDDGEPVEVMGVMIDNPQEAMKNFREALMIADLHLNIDIEDIVFQNLPGSAVGESADGKIILSPKTLNANVAFLLVVLAHEKLHADGAVTNEAVIQLTAEELVKERFPEGSGIQLTAPYANWIRAFENFAKLYPFVGSENDKIKHLYELYLQGRFEDVYQVFMMRFVTPEQKMEAQKVWDAAFPELERTELAANDN